MKQVRETSSTYRSSECKVALMLCSTCRTLPIIHTSHIAHEWMLVWVCLLHNEEYTISNAFDKFMQLQYLNAEDSVTGRHCDNNSFHFTDKDVAKFWTLVNRKNFPFPAFHHGIDRVGSNKCIHWVCIASDYKYIVQCAEPMVGLAYVHAIST